MDNRAIGVFDTDGGGLCAVRQLRRLMPQESILYVCDNAGAPYGERGKEDIAREALRFFRFLDGQDIKLLLCACGTVSAFLQEINVKSISTPLLGVLQPCAQEGCAASANGKIGLIGPTAAVRSGAYGRAVRNIRTEARVVGAATPLLDPFTEGCLAPEDSRLVETIADYLAPLRQEGADTLLLASLAYTPLFGSISEAAQYGMTIIDPALTVARSVQSRLLHDGTQNGGEAATPRWLITGDTDRFAQDAPRFFGEALTNIKTIAPE